MIVIIDYKLGNSKSILNMLYKLGIEAIISGDEKDIHHASGLILPGVGSFDNGMNNLKKNGLIDILNETVLDRKTPILGICLGMQLMTHSSEEGSLQGLGWIDANTVRFNLPENTKLKVPHMGWSEVQVMSDNKLFESFQEESRFYHVHSYHVECNDKHNILANSYYGYEFTTSFCSKNIYGVQFHPEKSHKFGMHLLSNYSKLLG